MTWPPRYGGQGRSQLERYVVLEELLGAGAPVAAHWIADRQTGPLLLRYGTEEQRQRFLPPIARGECYFSIGMSEPDAGSDLASVRLTGRRVAKGWRLRGSKLWASHAHRNHYMVALVRTSSADSDKHAGLSQMIVDLRAEGVEVRPIKLMSGQPQFSEVIFNDARVPDDAVVGELGAGWEQVTAELAYERSGPERFLSTFPLLLHLARHVRSSDEIRGLQSVGELTARLWSLRALSLSVAECLDRGEDPTVAAAMVKDMGTVFERDTVEAARLIVPVGRRTEEFSDLYREALMAAPGFTLRGGTTEILRTVIARALLPNGPRGPYLGLSPETATLLLDTATAVFGRETNDVRSALERSGLKNVANEGLVAAGLVVRTAAYFGTGESYAHRLLAVQGNGEELGALLKAVQIGGAMARVRDLTIKYTRDRQQFGQPLIRFQAVQHHVAMLAMESAASDQMTAVALADPRREMIAAAKIVASRSAGRVAGYGHQAHGAIGLTEEHDLHRFTIPLWRWRDEFGNEAEWALVLGRFIAARDLWEETTR